MWPLAKILPYERNPRVHPPEEIEALAADMVADGVTMPILVDEGGVIIAGHGRLSAAGRNGFERYPVVVARGWSEEQKASARLRDNQRTLQGSWDAALLKIEIEGLRLAGYDMPLLGFGEAELMGIFGGEAGGDGGRELGIGSLADRFGVVPFSVLNAREGWWQDRKRAWLALGIQSELGRGDNLLKFSDTLLEPDPDKRAKKNGAQVAR